MIEATAKQLAKKETYLLYIYTPFCGTCHVARQFLEHVEATLQQDIFYEMNAMYEADFMQQYKVESVPCLFIVRNGKVKEKVYTFYSIQNIYNYLLQYAPELFAE
ncbi:MAG TPA: thioredoxin family protein [Pseudogracilibacillus sp.]|nr:thioredoxin family protein [Pseudogracilibacillus sp.]